MKKSDISQFAQRLLDWYYPNARALPWRETQDPYKIWLSEIILQQTQVKQGLPYYEAFVSKYPTVNDLANAPLDDVLHLWQGLGYYSRARNLHHAACTVRDTFSGQFPQTLDGIASLKGIGDYTAAAIASFAFGIPAPVIDGNVYRVITRLFDISLPIDKAAGKNAVKKQAEALIPPHKPADYNQAIMEFGATHCTPRNPKCPSCPFAKACQALKNQTIEERPVKSPKKPVRHRHLHFFITTPPHDLWLAPRLAGDIWQGLYQFPLVETANAVNIEQLKQSTEFIALFGKDFEAIERTHAITHLLSHQKLHCHFYEVDTKKQFQGYQRIARPKLLDYPMPNPIRHYAFKYILV